MRNDRIIQVVSRYAGMALTSGALFVFDRIGRDLPDDSSLLIDNAAFAFASLIVGVAMVFLDPWIHRLNNGGIFDAPKNKGLVSPANAKTTQKNGGA